MKLRAPKTNWKQAPSEISNDADPQYYSVQNKDGVIIATGLSLKNAAMMILSLNFKREYVLRESFDEDNDFVVEAYLSNGYVLKDPFAFGTGETIEDAYNSLYFDILRIRSEPLSAIGADGEPVKQRDPTFFINLMNEESNLMKEMQEAIQKGITELQLMDEE